jgi:hypothetical protein
LPYGRGPKGMATVNSSNGEVRRSTPSSCALAM